MHFLAAPTEPNSQGEGDLVLPMFKPHPCLLSTAHLKETGVFHFLKLVCVLCSRGFERNLPLSVFFLLLSSFIFQGTHSQMEGVGFAQVAYICFLSNFQGTPEEIDAQRLGFLNSAGWTEWGGQYPPKTSIWLRCCFLVVVLFV